MKAIRIEESGGPETLWLRILDGRDVGERVRRGRVVGGLQVAAGEQASDTGADDGEDVCQRIGNAGEGAAGYNTASDGGRDQGRAAAESLPLRTHLQYARELKHGNEIRCGKCHRYPKGRLIKDKAKLNLQRRFLNVRCSTKEYHIAN